MKKNITAILLMGGIGQRCNLPIPKQFIPLSGKPVFQRTLDTLLASELFDEIILVTHSEWIDKIPSQKRVKVVSSGKTRQESTYLGLLACEEGTEYVLIHDAVRPFVSNEILTKNIEAVKKYKAVDTCIPSADTIVYTKDQNTITSIPNRACYKRGQTPQTFAYDLIVKAHRLHLEKITIPTLSTASPATITTTPPTPTPLTETTFTTTEIEKTTQEALGSSKHLTPKVSSSHSTTFDSIASNGPTDDCSLVVAMGHDVHIVEGDEKNIKITTSLDLFLAEQLLRTSSYPNTPKKEMDFTGKSYVITGGTGGIGSKLHQALVAKGATVHVISRSSKTFQTDLTNYQETKQTFDKLFSLYGEIDGIINCIGYLKVSPLSKTPIDIVHKIYETNLLSVIHTCKCAKIKPKGHILNLASSSYFKGRGDYATYSSAKAGIVNFTQGLSEERDDLFINVAIPRRTDTAMRRDNFPNEIPSDLLDPEDVADRIIDLLGQQITGTILEIK